MHVEVVEDFVERATELVHVLLEGDHVGLVLLAQVEIDEQELEELEGARLVVAHVYEEDADDEAQALTVADVRVEDGVGLEHVEERQLAGAELDLEVGVCGKGAAEVEQYGVLMDGVLLEQVVVAERRLAEELGGRGGGDRVATLLVLLDQEEPDVLATPLRHALVHRLTDVGQVDGR